MKKVFSLFVTVIMLFSFAQTVSASEVTYSGNSGDFVFTPGSDYSPTDLFSNFKSVMPGDNITQGITVKNEAEKTREKVQEGIEIDDPTGMKRKIHKTKKFFDDNKGAVTGGILFGAPGALIGSKLDEKE